MAFGVKWNRLRPSAARLRGARTNRPRPRPHPRRARAPSRSEPTSRAGGGAARRARSLHPPPLHSSQDGKGEEGGGRGRARAVSHFPCQSKTHTHTHPHAHSQTQTRSRDTGRAHNRGSRAFAMARARGDKGSPPHHRPAASKGGISYAHTPPRAVLPTPLASCRPRKGEWPWHRQANYSPNTTQESSTKQDTRRREAKCKSSSPGRGLTWEHPKPGADEGQKYEAADAGLAALYAYHKGSAPHPGRPRAAVTTASSSSLSASGSPLPPSPLWLGRSQSSIKLRAVRFSCVTSSCSSSCSGSFTFP